MKRIFILILVICGVFTSFAADKPIGWRHDGTGSFPDAKVVTTWSKDENVIWKTKLNKWSNASPVVLKDRIFVCEEPGVLVCIKPSDGSIMWRNEVKFEDLFTAGQKAQFQEAQTKGAAIQRKLQKIERDYGRVRRDMRKKKDNPEVKARYEKLKAEVESIKNELAPYKQFLLPKTHGVTGYTSNTPVTDGKNVFVFYGTEAVAGYTVDGEKKWVRRIEPGVPTRANWGHSSSLALVDGKVIAHISKMHALDAETGKTVWETATQVGWGTPVIADIDGLKIIISDSGEILKASDGSKLTPRPLNRLEFNSPLFQDGVLYFIQGKSTAYRLKREGDKLGADLLWQVSIQKDRYYASPVVYKGLVYDITQKGVFTVLDASKGQKVYTQNLKFSRGQVYPSVTLLGDKIFLGNEGGTVYIIEPGKEFKQVSKFEFEKFRSNPVAIGGRIYIRTLEHLYCIGTK